MLQIPIGKATYAYSLSALISVSLVSWLPKQPNAHLLHSHLLSQVPPPKCLLLDSSKCQPWLLKMLFITTTLEEKQFWDVLWVRLSFRFHLGDTWLLAVPKDYQLKYCFLFVRKVPEFYGSVAGRSTHHFRSELLCSNNFSFLFIFTFLILPISVTVFLWKLDLALFK